MSKILSGAPLRELKTKELKEKISALGGTVPTLVIIQIGERQDSSSYIESKKKYASEVGAKVVHTQFPETVTDEVLLQEIEKLNNDHKVQGIIVQLPVPLTIDKDTLLNSISPSKDVDGLGAENMRKLIEGRVDAVVPGTTRGILSLLAYYEIPVAGKRVTVLGRSSLVGKPTAIALMNEDATVTVCHSKTINLLEELRRAEILVVAIGKPQFVGQAHVVPGQIIIDVGINFIEIPSETSPTQLLPKMVGDVNHSEVKDIVAAYTPVPGGVGQMTVVSLFENLYDLCVTHHV